MVLSIRVSDPDSIGFVDPDPALDLGGKNYQQKKEKVKKFHILKSWMLSLEG